MIFTKENANKIRKQLDLVGYCELPDFISQDLFLSFVKDIEDSIHLAKPSSGYKYSLKYEAIVDHKLAQLVNSNQFRDFVNIILKDLSMPIENDQIKIGYSILKGKGDKVPYHFDSLNLLNIIFPIILPNKSKNFIDLWTLPNIISFHPKYFEKIKFIVIMKIPFLIKLFRKGIKYHERSLHAFYGSRTFHGVEPILVDGLRVIASINIRFSK